MVCVLRLSANWIPLAFTLPLYFICNGINQVCCPTAIYVQLTIRYLMYTHYYSFLSLNNAIVVSSTALLITIACYDLVIYFYSLVKPGTYYIDS